MAFISLTLLLTTVFTDALPRTRATVNECLDSANVPQLTPGSANFTQATKPFNLRLPYTPTAVATPSNVTHVQAAVSCGARAGVMVSAKSGGHSYASHGIGGENGHLMIDLKYFNTVSLDNDTNVATIGPGARLGNVATALYNQGERAFSHGTCPGYFHFFETLTRNTNLSQGRPRWACATWRLWILVANSWSCSGCLG